MAAEVVDDRYRLEERLAIGGMGEVWAAHDLELERRVAVKLLHPTADPVRFEREARASAALSHPSICQLYDYGEADGRPYIVLEYLAGGTLEARLSPGEPIPDDDAERIAGEIAAGLAYAHAAGLVHRDLKPGNVLFDEEGSAKITDFGIARIADASTLTEAGTLLGTAAYMSPEQARGEGATPASDVYAFGVILFQLLTGRLPFEAQSPLELAAMHESAEPPLISSLRSDAPPDLERLATAALAKRPEDRPHDGRALAAALAREPTEAATIALVPPPRTPDDGTGPPTSRQRRPTRVLVLGTALAALAAAGIAAALLATAGSSDAPAQEPRLGSVTRSDTAPATTARSTTRATTRTTPTRTGTTGVTTTTAPIPGTQTQPPTTTTPPTSAPTTTAPTTPTTTEPPPTATTTAPTTTTTTTTDTSTVPGATTTAL